MRVALVGMGSWGTAVGVHLAREGHTVLGWARGEGRRQLLKTQRENQKYLPGCRFPDLLQVEDRVRDAVEMADAVVLAVPSHALREVSEDLAPLVGHRIVVNLAKGLEEGTRARMLEILFDTLGPDARVASLVGPSHAEEVVLGFPTAVVVTSEKSSTSEAVQDLFTGDRFRVYTNPDRVGVELAVALKNVMALAAGISGGLGFGDNTLGTLITRGLSEMTRLGTTLGGKAETFFGLAGVGDLVTTCASRHSRNRRVGEALARGESLEEILGKLGMVAEGVRTTAAAHDLARAKGVEMPIVNRVHAVLFEGQAPEEAIRELMGREPTSEHTSRRDS
jgi:glycerol-3-phosphate dehydrogenase (NAD(P)+)